MIKSFINGYGHQPYFGFVATGINNAAHIGGMDMSIPCTDVVLKLCQQVKTILKILGLLGAVIITGVLYVLCTNQLTVTSTMA